MIQLNDLKLFGGTPQFNTHLTVGAPQTSDFEQLSQKISEIFKRNWLTNSGPVLQAFETALCDYLGAKHCIVVCNGTMALMLLLKALNLQGEVIVPSFTFAATVHALEWLGLTPVFCDVSPDDHNLNPQEIKRLITPRSTAILGVHLWGQACQPEVLEQIAQEHQLTLIFDSAHAFSCKHQNKFIGNFGHAEVFSFHATKLFHSLEGGAIITHSDELANKIRQLNNFGFQDGKAVSVGINGKMNEVSAAVGLHNLSYLPQIIAHNRSCYQDYAKYLNDLPGLRLLPLHGELNYQYVVLEIEAEFGLHRDMLKSVLFSENVLTKSYFEPVHQSLPYREHCQNLELPVTDQLAQRVLVLPTGQQMTPEKIERLCALIRLIQAQASHIQMRLKEL